MNYLAEKNPVAIVGFFIFLVMIVGQGVAIPGSPEIRTDKDVYAPNEEIVILFENLPDHPRNWIALAKRGAPDQRPLGRYTYMKGGVTSGRTALGGLSAGEYEVRAYKGGSREVLARYPFRIQLTPTSAAESPEAEPVALEATPAAPASSGQEEIQTTSQPLPPEMLRLVGNWVGHTRCDIQGSGRDGQQKLFLRVREDRAKPSGFAAEVRGIGYIAGVALDISWDTDSQQYMFSFAGWSPTGRGSKQKPYGLRLAFLHDKEMLHGEIVTDSFACETVVAGKLPSEAAPPNPHGLLFKVANKRVLQPFTEDECAAYGQWLAAGEGFQVSGWFSNTALGDGPAMREVLGHDLEQWTDDDTRKIEVIHRTCLQLLRGATDPALINLAHDRKLGGLAAPLRLSKSKYPGAWDETFYALNRPLVMDLLKTWELLDEGLLEESGETMIAELQIAPGLDGEWRGYYQCDGGHEVFMRLAFTANSDPLDVRLEIGSSLRTAHPFGVLAMSGSFNATSGRIILKPHEWILEPRGQNRPLGIEGQLIDDEKIIEGRMEGLQNG